uniref:CPG4 domain-containing protein n=1 Tax=Elaeophora elaphi TaxID=1147741 RepID=A0A0R3RTU1_9BILA
MSNFTTSFLAQIPPQPIATTGSTCLNDCLKQGSLVFAASNLRNFRKIILHVEEFCDTREQLMKCAQSCTDEEREELAKMTSLSAYICKDKIEEFRLVKECMESQEDIDGVNKCSTECGHPSDATIQLDSSPAASVNPFAFIDSITQDIGFKQVVEANDQLQADAFNSSSTTQQLTKIYLESLPQQCTYIINPTNYNMTFAQKEANDELSTVMPETSEIEGNTMRPSSITDEEGMKQMTPEVFNTNSDAVITRILEAELTTQSNEASRDDDVMTTEIEKEATMMTARSETEDESDVFMRSSSVSDEAASATENGDNASMKSETSVQIHIQSIPSHETTGHEEEEGKKDESVVSSSVAFTSTDDQSRVEEDVEKGTNHGPEKEELEEEQEQEEERKEEEEKDESVMLSSKKDEATMITGQKSNENDEERENSDEMENLQHSSTPAAAQEMTERTIVIVNDDKDHEIDTNTITIQPNAVEQQQKDATKQGIRERIALSLLLILPLISLHFSNQ